MHPQILGISGSPIKNSNTDRLIQAVLNSSGLESDFIKLSKLNVKPCIACLGCKKDNICKVNDDFPELAEKVRKADAIVVGGYAPYGSVDGFTKAFLERFWSFRHQKNLLKGKLVATILTGCVPDALATVNQSMARRRTSSWKDLRSFPFSESYPPADMALYYSDKSTLESSFFPSLSYSRTKNRTAPTMRAIVGPDQNALPHSFA